MVSIFSRKKRWRFYQRRLSQLKGVLTKKAVSGRPRYELSEEQLEHLLHLGFDCSVIASILGISLRTVRRRMNEFGLSVRSSHSDIDNDELKRAVQQIKVNFPCSGYRIIDGLLRQRGIRVQQLRLREVVQSIDPHGITATCGSCSTKTIQYTWSTITVAH